MKRANNSDEKSILSLNFASFCSPLRWLSFQLRLLSIHVRWLSFRIWALSTQTRSLSILSTLSFCR